MKTSDLIALGAELDAYAAEFDGCFVTRATAEHLGVYLRGQLGSLPRKSIEPMALEAGVAPRTLQEFLSLHRWDETLLGRRVRELVARDHGSDNALGVIDETSVAKKGHATVGVQRQYCGSTGKVDNCVVTVHLGYAAGPFQAIIDSDIYLPIEWAENEKKREAAGIPADVGFRPKWEIALDLVDRSLRDGVPLRWITADEGYGRYPGFLNGLSARGLTYVVEVPTSTQGWTLPRFHQHQPDLRLNDLWDASHKAWTPYRVKDTDRGPLVWKARATRFYPSWDASQELWVIAARHALSGEKKYFLSNASSSTPLTHLLTVAFGRWTIERLFEDAKQEIGLAHFEVRKYRALQRHLAVSMASLLFLERVRASRGGPKNIAIDSAAPTDRPGSRGPDIVLRWPEGSPRPRREEDRLLATVGR